MQRHALYGRSCLVWVERAVLNHGSTMRFEFGNADVK